LDAVGGAIALPRWASPRPSPVPAGRRTPSLAGLTSSAPSVGEIPPSVQSTRLFRCPGTKPIGDHYGDTDRAGACMRSVHGVTIPLAITPSRISMPVSGSSGGDDGGIAVASDAWPIA